MQQIGTPPITITMQEALGTSKAYLADSNAVQSANHLKDPLLISIQTRVGARASHGSKIKD